MKSIQQFGLTQKRGAWFVMSILPFLSVFGSNFESICINVEPTLAEEFRVLGVTHVVARNDPLIEQIVGILGEIDLLILENPSPHSPEIQQRAHAPWTLDAYRRDRISEICSMLNISEDFLQTLPMQQATAELMDQFYRKTGDFFRLEPYLISIAETFGIEILLLNSNKTSIEENYTLTRKQFWMTIDQLHIRLSQLISTGIQDATQSGMSLTPKTPMEGLTSEDATILDYIKTQNALWIDEISRFDLQGRKVLMLVGANHINENLNRQRSHNINEVLSIHSDNEVVH